MRNRRKRNHHKPIRRTHSRHSLTENPNNMKKTFVIGLCAALLAGPVTGADSTGTTAQKAVLVTGASTGIGRKITEQLAAAGYFVYAGARKDADLLALDAIENVDAVRLDVTKPEEIAAAVASISKAGRGLYGVVNN
jgi:NADPH:quinone reductase-like Zn-dependent oxidoreductase